MEFFIRKYKNSIGAGNKTRHTKADVFTAEHPDLEICFRARRSNTIFPNTSVRRTVSRHQTERRNLHHSHEEETRGSVNCSIESRFRVRRRAKRGSTSTAASTSAEESNIRADHHPESPIISYITTIEENVITTTTFFVTYRHFRGAYVAVKLNSFTCQTRCQNEMSFLELS